MPSTAAASSVALLPALQKYSMNERKTVDLEDGWSHMQVGICCDLQHLQSQSSLKAVLGPAITSLALQSGITKLKKLLEGEQESSFNAEQYMMLYT